MIENIVTLKVPPGFYRNGTVYQAKGRWYDGDLVRFIEGTIRPIGGWRVLADAVGNAIATLTGRPRAAIAYRTNAGEIRLAVGTHSKLYALTASVLTDITPTDLTVGNENGVLLGGSGGSGVYGELAYGYGIYGGGGGLASTLVPADTWTLDTFGEALVAVLTSDNRILTWPDPNGGGGGGGGGGGSGAYGAGNYGEGVYGGYSSGVSTNPAVPVANAPSASAVVVTPERFLVALGANGDPRLVAWASQETMDDWTPSATNSAGDFPLSTSGALMCGRRTRRQTLLWTDADLWTMTYLPGSTLIYGFDQVGEACGTISRNAVAMVGSEAFWMGRRSFFRFDGYVQPMPCEVSDAVFSDMNIEQKDKIVAHTIAEFHEVWWHYPSATSMENDRYVVYNYRENHWTTGALGRGAGVDRGPTPSPILVSTSGVMYEHEYGQTRSSTPYIESGPLELGEGERIQRVQHLVPDDRSRGDVTINLYVSNWPGDAERSYGPFIFTSSNVPRSVRATGRVVRLLASEARATDWRLGHVRMGVRPQGRR